MGLLNVSKGYVYIVMFNKTFYEHSLYKCFCSPEVWFCSSYLIIRNMGNHCVKVSGKKFVSPSERQILRPLNLQLSLLFGKVSDLTEFVFLIYEFVIVSLLI